MGRALRSRAPARPLDGVALLRARRASRHGAAVVVGLGAGVERGGHRSPSAGWSPRRSGSSRESAPSTTGSTGSRAARPVRTTTRGTAHTSWKDYFKVNTDHKVIGIQYLVTTFFFFTIGGLHGDAVPRRARAARAPVLRHADLQRARVGARDADDLRLHHPGVRRARELRRAADARRARHGVPSPERALLLDAAHRGRDVPRELPRARAARSARAGRATRRSPRGSRSARRSSTWASSGQAPRRS